MRVGPSGSAFRSRSQTTPSGYGQKPWWCCVKKARERHAVREMEDVDPSEPSCRRGLQTAMSCFVTMAGVVNVMVKRRGLTASCMNEGDERKRIPAEASKRLRWHQNRSFTTAPG